MGTKRLMGGLGSSLFGKARQKILALLYGRPHESFYLREIIRSAGMGQGGVQRELGRLVEAGLLVRTRKGKQVYYGANPTSPVFAEIKSLMVKTAGIADVLRDSLAKFGRRVKVSFIYGSFAAGTEKAGSDVDVMVIGNVTFREIADSFRSVQEIVGWEINPTVYSSKEWQNKLHSGHHFVNSVNRLPKIFLIGDELVLRKLGPKRVAR